MTGLSLKNVDLCDSPCIHVLFYLLLGQTKKAAVTPSTSVTKIKKSDQVTRTGINTNGALNLKSEITTIFITFLSIYIAVMRFF